MLSQNDHKVLKFVTKRMSGGAVELSYEEIAAGTKLSLRTVIRRMQKLLKEKLLKVEVGGGTRVRNVYKAV